jgi:hypothetical protein
MRVPLAVLALVFAALSLATGCGGVDVDPDPEPPPEPSGGVDGGTCTAGTVASPCPGVAQGFSCSAGGNPPEDHDPNLSCSTATPQPDGDDDYCCVLALPGTSCTPLALACPDDQSFAYECLPGDDPSKYDGSLACTDPRPDADGVHDDYCCTYGVGG